MSINNAFNLLLGQSARNVQIQRVSGTPLGPFTIEVSPSNYHRNLAVVEEIVSKGYEFVISEKVLDAVSFGEIKRGDIIIDPDMGNLTISEVTPMFLLGNLVGYRVRTN